MLRENIVDRTAVLAGLRRHGDRRSRGASDFRNGNRELLSVIGAAGEVRAEGSGRRERGRRGSS